MIILNIFESIKINLNNTFDNIIEQLLFILATFACSSGLITVAFDIVERIILWWNGMEQDPNGAREAEEVVRDEDADVEMIEEDDDDLLLLRQAVELLIDADGFIGADDGGDNDVEEVMVDEVDDIDVADENENDEFYYSSDSENGGVIIPSEEEDIKKFRDFVLRIPIFDKTHYHKKPMYQFKPYRLTKDGFSNKCCFFSNIPLARSGHRIIADSGNLYSLGGYNPRAAISAGRNGRCMLFQELWCYNFATRHWKTIMTFNTMPNMPRELVSNALVMYNNVLISYGGTGFPFGESCSNDCYVFSTNREKPFLARLPVTGELPTPLYGPAVVVHDDYLYTIGGTTGFDYSCDVFRLNLKTRQWECVYISRPEMRDDPDGRYRHEIVYDGKYVYVLGGGTSLNVYDLQQIPAFNLNTNRWEYFDTLPDQTVILEAAAAPTDPPEEYVGFPKPRKCFSCVQHKMDNGDIEAFITGGLQGDFNTYFDDVWKLSLRTMQWTLIRTAKLPKALYFHSAAGNNSGLMYIFGGIECDEMKMRRRNLVYKMWMTIPKLSEICWEAITYYNSYLCAYNRNILLSYGIPDRFVNRVEFFPN